MLKLLFVFVGGGIGSLLRYGVGCCWGKHIHCFPWSTLAINLVGSFLIGILSGCLLQRNYTTLYALTVIGFCGGFTTFSTFSLEAFNLIRQGFYFYAFAYVFLSAVIGISLTFLGITLVERL